MQVCVSCSEKSRNLREGIFKWTCISCPSDYTLKDVKLTGTQRLREGAVTDDVHTSYCRQIKINGHQFTYRNVLPCDITPNQSHSLVCPGTTKFSTLKLSVIMSFRIYTYIYTPSTLSTSTMQLYNGMNAIVMSYPLARCHTRVRITHKSLVYVYVEFFQTKRVCYTRMYWSAW